MKEFIEELEQLDRKREEIVHHLGKIDPEMVYTDYGLHLIYNYRVKILKKSE